MKLKKLLKESKVWDRKFGVSSPDELGSDEKKKEFFNYVDKNYKAKAEGKR